MSPETPHIIRRADRGLTIAGTRTTLYALLDYIHDGWAYDDLRDALGLSGAQLRVALDYISAHRDEVEAEYNQVVRDAAADRQHWEAYTATLLATRPRPPITPEKAALYAKLAEQREQTIRDLLDEEQRHAPKAALP